MARRALGLMILLLFYCCGPSHKGVSREEAVAQAAMLYHLKNKPFPAEVRVCYLFGEGDKDPSEILMRNRWRRLQCC
jgi:hypothetical protein